MSEARVKVSVADGTTIEIEGTDAFVTAQLEKFGESIRAGLAGKSHRAAPISHKGVEAAAAPAAGPAADPLAAIFDMTDKGLTILVDIPGKSDAEKTVNAARLLAHWMMKFRNRNFVFFREVKAVCRAHRCYDSKNMATVLRRRRSTFVFGGSGQKQTLSLTEAGTKEAERLISLM
jgi:hypothetical protein